MMLWAPSFIDVSQSFLWVCCYISCAASVTLGQLAKASARAIQHAGVCKHMTLLGGGGGGDRITAAQEMPLIWIWLFYLRQDANAPLAQV